MSILRCLGLRRPWTVKRLDDGQLQQVLSITLQALELVLLVSGPGLVLLMILYALGKMPIVNLFAIVFGIGTSMIFGLALCRALLRSLYKRVGMKTILQDER